MSTLRVRGKNLHKLNQLTRIKERIETPHLSWPLYYSLLYSPLSLSVAIPLASLTIHCLSSKLAWWRKWSVRLDFNVIECDITENWPVDIAGHNLGHGGLHSCMWHVMHSPGNQPKLLNVASMREVNSSLGGLTWVRSKTATSTSTTTSIFPPCNFGAPTHHVAPNTSQTLSWKSWEWCVWTKFQEDINAHP